MPSAENFILSHIKIGTIFEKGLITVYKNDLPLQKKKKNKTKKKTTNLLMYHFTLCLLCPKVSGWIVHALTRLNVFTVWLVYGKLTHVMSYSYNIVCGKVKLFTLSIQTL